MTFRIRFVVWGVEMDTVPTLYYRVDCPRWEGVMPLRGMALWTLGLLG